MSERSIFLTALEIIDTAACAAYLDAACQHDPHLRDPRRRALLAAHDSAGGFMHSPAAHRDPLTVLTDHGRLANLMTRP